jgi:hypothetical protein
VAKEYRGTTLGKHESYVLTLTVYFDMHHVRTDHEHIRGHGRWLESPEFYLRENGIYGTLILPLPH